MIITLAVALAFTLWPNNASPAMTGEAPSGTQSVVSESQFDVIVKTFDKDTYFNDVTQELEQHPNGDNVIQLGAINSGTTVAFTMNSFVDGLRTYTHRIKAIKVEIGQPAQIRIDYYTAVDTTGIGLLDDENVPFQHTVQIGPPAVPPDGGG